MDSIKRTRLKFFFVTAGIAVLLIALFCTIILVTTLLRPLPTIKIRLDIDDIEGIQRNFERVSFERLLLIVLLSGGGGILLVVVLVWFLSYWMVKPAEQSLAKQRRFVSEASHELKTPLTVISAGVELLQKEKGLSQDAKHWIGDIKAQAKKMTKMTTDMLSLSKIEEDFKQEIIEFNLSEALLTNILPFESVAFEQSKRLVYDEIEENIFYKGNLKAVSNAVEILCDNAIKHSSEKGIIKIGLKKQNQKAVLNVTNTGDNITEKEIPFLFERFYRGSDSRAKTQGVGLGLSILKTMAEKNGWKIDVKCDKNEITFTIIF